MVSFLESDPTGILHSGVTREGDDSTEEEREVCGEIMSRFDLSEQSRKGWDWEAEFNRLMLRGDQLVARDSASGAVIRLTLSDESKQRRYSIDNKLKPISRALVGKHTRVIPSAMVMSATDDESDLRGAEIGSAWLAYFFRKERLKKKYVKAHRYLRWAGTAIWSIQWDKLAGRKVAWCKECDVVDDELLIGTPCPACSAENEGAAEQQNMQAMMQWRQEAAAAADTGMEPPGQPEPQEPEEGPPMIGVYEGDVTCGLHDPRDFYPEPGVEDIEDMRWGIIRRARPVSELRAMFPRFANQITEENGIHWERSITLDQTHGQMENLQDHAYLYEYHERPSQRYPEGRLIFVVNGRCVNQVELEDGEIMYGEPHPAWMLDRLPFFAFHWERNEGVFWGEAHITQNWPVQKERNRLLRQMREQRDLANNPVLLTPIGSKISKADFYQAEPGKIVKYNPTQAGPNGTKWLTVPPFASYTYSELERMEHSMREQASVTEQELGSSPSRESGRHAAIVESQSSESIRPMVVENNEEWLAMNKGALQLAQRYYDENRVFAIRGASKIRSYDWSQMNLSPGWDCYIAETDSLSQNPAIRLEQAQQLWAMGYYNDPATGMPDREKFARDAQLHDTSGPDSDAAEHVYAGTIPDRIIEGVFTPEAGPKPWDDASIAAREIGHWLRTEGRKQPEEKQWAVGQIWMGYAALANPQDPRVAKYAPNALAQQPPPAQPPGPGAGMGSGAMPGQGEASQTIQQADARGESPANAIGGDGQA